MGSQTSKWVLTRECTGPPPVKRRTTRGHVTHRSRLSIQRWVQLGIMLEFLVLVRTLAEYFRLRYRLGPTAGLAAFAPFVPPLLAGTIATWVTVLNYFAGRYRLALVLWLATLLGAPRL